MPARDLHGVQHFKYAIISVQAFTIVVRSPVVCCSKTSEWCFFRFEVRSIMLLWMRKCPDQGRLTRSVQSSNLYIPYFTTEAIKLEPTPFANSDLSLLC